jgi:UDP-2,4-diacetamido-2,4,6-trideoxy-beta-L-altropyranose hydrolase
MRCLALAQAWQDTGGNAIFAMAAPSSSIRERLLKEEMEVLEISASAGTHDDATRTAALAREQVAPWVVVDGYQFGADYQRVLKSAGLRILCGSGAESKLVSRPGRL